MTKQDAKAITDLKFELEQQAYNAKDEESSQVYLAWIKSIEPLYEKAQKILALRKGN